MQDLADAAAYAAQRRSPSCGSAASLEMYNTVHGDGVITGIDRDRISMKSDCGINMGRNYNSVVLNGQPKVLDYIRRL